MQTFMPYSDFEKTARCLDNKRLGKQRVEAWQILNTLNKIFLRDIVSKKLLTWNLGVHRSSGDYFFLVPHRKLSHLPYFQLSSSFFGENIRILVRGPKKKAKMTPKRFFL
jgi:hypothetical protein